MMTYILHINDNIPRSATVHTDSRITLQSLQNKNNHNYLIEEIRKLAITLGKNNWTINFTWIKAHIGISRQVSKGSQQKRPHLLQKNSQNWNNTSTEGTEHRQVAKPMVSHNKRQVTEDFFPIIKDRLTKKIKLTPKFTAIVTAHGKTKAYLHHFKIIESPDCPCKGGEQTVEHLLYDCNKLKRDRDELIRNISNQDKWPVNKSALVNKHTKHFTQFINSIDFERLWS